MLVLSYAPEPALQCLALGDNLGSGTTTGRKTMSDDPQAISECECAVCYTTHDEEIHQATLSIHRWFQHQVTHDFDDNQLYLHEFGAMAAV